MRLSFQGLMRTKRQNSLIIPLLNTTHPLRKPYICPMDAKSLIHLLPPYLHGPEGPYLLPAEEALYEATLYRRVAKLEAAT